jgi:hypothetical protein
MVFFLFQTHAFRINKLLFLSLWLVGYAKSNYESLFSQLKLNYTVIW